MKHTNTNICSNYILKESLWWLITNTNVNIKMYCGHDQKEWFNCQNTKKNDEMKKKEKSLRRLLKIFFNKN